MVTVYPKYFILALLTCQSLSDGSSAATSGNSRSNCSSVSRRLGPTSSNGTCDRLAGSLSWSLGDSLSQGLGNSSGILRA